MVVRCMDFKTQMDRKYSADIGGMNWEGRKCWSDIGILEAVTKERLQIKKYMGVWRLPSRATMSTMSPLPTRDKR